MARAYVKSPIPRPPNPLSRLFSQPSNFFTGYSSHPTFCVPTLEVSDRAEGTVYRQKGRCVGYRRVTIGTLPDDVLLEIFDFYMDDSDSECPYPSEYWEDGWHTLVHVCRSWRYVVFASPRRLRLQLLCTLNRSVKEMLHIWPELPIIISDSGYIWFQNPKTMENVENTISALELNDRVSVIRLTDSCSNLERFAAAMQDPFPALTHVLLLSYEYDGMAPVISDSFLGGSAPRLQHLTLTGISFPALPKLLLSATDLVILYLQRIPHSGYISPEAMVTSLSALTRLERLTIRFLSPLSRPAKASRRPPHLPRIVLSALIDLDFRGVTEYLEDLVAQIDAPLLVKFSITFFNQLVFDLLQLPKFLCRTKTFSVLDGAYVSFFGPHTYANFYLQTETINEVSLSLKILCKGLDWQLSSISQVCNSTLLALSTVEYLNLAELEGISKSYPPLIEDYMEKTQWLELLHPFTNVMHLHLTGKVPTWVAPAMEELTGERVKEVLPVLQDIFLDGLDAEPEPVPEAISEFVAARQLSGCPVAIHRRRKDRKNGTWVVIETRTQ